jgi:hypothetical protein
MTGVRSSYTQLVRETILDRLVAEGSIQGDVADILRDANYAFEMIKGDVERLAQRKLDAHVNLGDLTDVDSALENLGIDDHGSRISELENDSSDFVGGSWWNASLSSGSYGSGFFALTEVFSNGTDSPATDFTTKLSTAGYWMVHGGYTVDASSLTIGNEATPDVSSLLARVRLESDAGFFSRSGENFVTWNEAISDSGSGLVLSNIVLNPTFTTIVEVTSAISIRLAYQTTAVEMNTPSYAGFLTCTYLGP